MENLDPNHLRAGRGGGAPPGGESSDSLSSSLPSLRASSAASTSSASTSSSGIMMMRAALTDTTKQPRQQGGVGGRRVRPDDELSSGIDWVDSVVDVATTCKKMLAAHTCRLCQVYTDAQVEYEVRQEESVQQQGAFAAATSTFLPAMAMPSSLEVEMYRQFLFDEDSVVEGVNEREKVFGGEYDENDDEDDGDEQRGTRAPVAVSSST